jgi:hypothetical protein
MADGGANKMDRRVIPGGLGLRKLATKTNDLQYKDHHQLAYDTTIIHKPPY